MTSGPGMGPYRPRVELVLQYSTPANQRLAGRWDWGFFHSVRGVISPGGIRVRSRVVGVVFLCMCGWITIVGYVRPHRPQMAVSLCTIPGQ